MKHTFTSILCLLAAAILIAVFPVQGEGDIYHDVIRLHILAESDDPARQEDKLAVRDALLAEYGDTLGSCRDIGEAREKLDTLRPKIRETAEETLRARGCTAPVGVTLSEEEYPTRDYGTFSLPAGRYLSLRVIIGAGEGHNWWCVLYPPLCLDTAVERNGDTLSDAEWGLLTENGNGKYTARFRVLELLGEWFS